jgi:hypothetical protein
MQVGLDRRQDVCECIDCGAAPLGDALSRLAYFLVLVTDFADPSCAHAPTLLSAMGFRRQRSHRGSSYLIRRNRFQNTAHQGFCCKPLQSVV